MHYTGLINTLKLVYPPISNQEADWVSESEQVKEVLAHSNLYMIGQRQELFYKDYKIDKDNYTVTFDLVCGDRKLENVSLDCSSKLEDYEGEVLFEVGEKIFRLCIKENEKAEYSILYWATPDKLLYDSYHKRIDLENASNYRIFTEYKLHYVGISKKRDSLTRLFIDGHHKRVKILTNESQIRPEGRLTDELLIFFFRIEDMGIRTWDLDEEIEVGKEVDRVKILSDAEKAFIKILEAKYNTEDYSKYPVSIDGLFNEQVNRISYSIGENIVFHTDTASIKGSTNYFSLMDGEDFGDNIFVDLDTEEVTLLNFKGYKEG